jgi:hypothetical protein
VRELILSCSGEDKKKVNLHVGAVVAGRMSGDEGGKQRKAVRFPSNLEQLARVERCDLPATGCADRVQSSTTSLESSDAPLTDSLPLPVATTGKKKVKKKNKSKQIQLNTG